MTLPVPANISIPPQASDRVGMYRPAQMENKSTIEWDIWGIPPKWLMGIIWKIPILWDIWSYLSMSENGVFLPKKWRTFLWNQYDGASSFGEPVFRLSHILPSWSIYATNIWGALGSFLVEMEHVRIVFNPAKSCSVMLVDLHPSTNFYTAIL